MAFDDAGNRERVKLLRQRGVDVWGPERVYVDESVDLSAIEVGAVVRQATLSGPNLTISAGAIIGTSGHAEVDDCQIGPGAELGSGLYRGATFLAGVKIRGFAEVRPATLLEESVDVAHCVALKNTTVTACCVAGSLINFCDVFLTGGTSRTDHTEIGSGAIHYNFDPRGDKWGSLLGDIRGVLRRSAPVFVGGHCGLVGPVEVGLGAVTAAGSTIRRDVVPNTLAAMSGREAFVANFDRNSYGSLRRAFLVTGKFVATLRALDVWYAVVRIPHADRRDRALYESGRVRIKAQLEERIARLGKVIDKLSTNTASQQGSRIPGEPHAEHLLLIKSWDRFRSLLEEPLDPGTGPDRFIEAYASARAAGLGHVASVKAAEGHAADAEAWLEGLVAGVTKRAAQLLGPA